MSEYEAKLKYGTANVGSGTVNTTTYLRGDLTWQAVTAPVDLSSIEDSAIMLAWDTYADDRTFDDIAVDNFADTTGIETGSSSGYTASTGYISPTASENMVLVSQEWEASANTPTAAFCLLNLEPIDAVTLDTDIKAYVSNDDGATYQQITGLVIVQTIGANQFVRGDLSSITWATPADKTMRLKVTGHNNGSNTKQFKLHAWALGVKY